MGEGLTEPLEGLSMLLTSSKSSVRALSTPSVFGLSLQGFFECCQSEGGRVDWAAVPLRPFASLLDQ